MKFLLSSIALLFIVVNLTAQNISYTYDNAGNRITRTSTSTRSAQEVDVATGINPVNTEPGIKVHPNPTEGVLAIEIGKYTAGSSIEFTLTNLSGNTLMRQRVSTAYQTMDLSHLADGMYILRITIDGENHIHKIIKK